MVKINFKEFRLKESFNSSETKTADLREAFADLIYVKTSGIRGLKLAEKIYQSKGSIELDETETMILKQLVDEACTPQIIDAMEQYFNKK